jgi:hypothetical protein
LILLERYFLLKRILRNLPFLSLFFTLLVSGQEKSIERLYVPIIFKYVDPLIGLKIDEWTAFKYDRLGNTFSPIPFQVDELSPDGKYNRTEYQDGIIDGRDELLLMPGDLGDRAATSAWLDDPNAKLNERYELACTDPLDGKTGWAYLFKNVSQKPEIRNYISYSKGAAGTGADTVKSSAYHVGSNEEGWIDFISMAPDFDRNRIDRLKLRLAGSSITLTENVLKAQNDPSTFYEKPIRSFHDRRYYLHIDEFPALSSSVDPNLHFFPYSFKTGVKDAELESPLLLSLFGVNSLRQSLDFSPQSSGMRFYSAKNREGVAIDGNLDDVDLTLNQGTPDHWVMVGSNLGTIVMILKSPSVPNSTTQLYYHDAGSGVPLDNSQDTGDGLSFGDMGLWIHASVLVTDRVTMNFIIYLINQGGMDAGFGELIFQREQNPVVVESSQQNYLTLVKQETSPPGSFLLYDVWPNPSRLSQSNVQFEFSLSPAQAPARISVFNSLGQLVYSKNLHAVSARQMVSWDGRDLNGSLIPPGIYFAWLQGLSKSIMKKFVVMD